MKIALLICLLGVLAVLTLAALQRVRFPYGKRPAAMLVMYYALRCYANDHDGTLPDSPRGPFAALTSLYPHYCPTGFELAGLSGAIERAQAALRAGSILDESTCSWAYFPGLRVNDNPSLAVLYERREGIRSGGRRSDDVGHAALLLDGTITNVPRAAWTSFLQKQESLRRAALSQ